MSVTLTRLLLAALAATGSLASPTVKRQTACTAPKQRRAWHTLNDEEKRAYIDAERCLMEKPGTLGLYGGVTKFDELQSAHVLSTGVTHRVGAFLPFHRLLIFAHETLLETECGYTGGQPYWQEQLDSGNFINSVLLDPVTGFGGDGNAENECITDGPFASYTNQIGIGYDLQEQCIRRNINDTASAYTSDFYVDSCLAATGWEEAWTCIESWPHYGGHSGVGAQMSNPISSPGDPLFYMHHTWLDKMWADWQSFDPERRTSEIWGENRQLGNREGQEPCGGVELFGAPPPEIPGIQIEGDNGGCQTTLGHVLDMRGIIPSRSIGEVMHTVGEVLCYEYVQAA